MDMRKLLGPGLVLGLLLGFGPGAQAAGDLPLVVNGSTGQFQQLPSATTLATRAPTTANASINLPPGTAPTSPNNGDCWTTSLGLYCQIAGSTVGPYNTGAPFSLTAGNTALTVSPSPWTGGAATISCANATSSAIGCVKPDNSTITISGGVITAVLPPTTVTLTASESLAAGALVSIWDNSGTANVRNANATDATKTPDGFVLASVASSGTATVYIGVQTITGLTSLTPGTVYFLSTTGGAITATAPSTSGNWLQIVGKSLSATTFLYEPQAGVQL